MIPGDTVTHLVRYHYAPIVSTGAVTYCTTSTAGSITTTGGWTIAGNHPWSISPQFVTCKEKPMLEPVPCPLCNSPAVRDDDGSDAILETLHDHKPPKEARTSTCRTDWEPNGVILRVRCCATCGHLYASRTSPVKEVPCTPGK
jgi:hypothetical protein